MSTVLMEKPRCRGRGIGVGWIGTYKPKPCRVTKEDVVNLRNLRQSFADAPTHAPLVSQTSVDNLSDRIARDILNSQGDEEEPGQKKKTARTTIDLTGSTDDESQDSVENSRSWIDFIESDESENDFTFTNVKKENGPADEKESISTENIMKTYNDLCQESPCTSPREFHTPSASPIPPNVRTSPKTNHLNGNIDEKPVTSGGKFSDSNESITDEINACKANTKDHKQIFMNAVHADEFVPSWCMAPHTSDEKIPNDYFVPGDEKIVPFSEPQPFDDLFEDTVVLYVLDEVIAALVEDPGDFDNVIDQLTDHLVNFVTQEDTLKQVIDRIIGKAMTEPNFGFMTARLARHFDECKAVELENGVTFRKVFFRNCQMIHGECVSLCKDAGSCAENKEKIERVSLLFGELLCTMKLKDKVNPVFRNVINNYIDIFLDIGSEETIVILTTLLKLVGPELDVNRPKDVEALFDRVKDFYLDSSRSGHLTKPVKTNLWGVYKLHSRDWDRATSPLDTASIYFNPEPPIPPNPLLRQTSLERQSSRSSPVDWDDYYDGVDDLDLFQNYTHRSSITDEECDAFEEFLKISGQVE